MENTILKAKERSIKLNSIDIKDNFLKEKNKARVNWSKRKCIRFQREWDLGRLKLLKDSLLMITMWLNGRWDSNVNYKKNKLNNR